MTLKPRSAGHIVLQSQKRAPASIKDGRLRPLGSLRNSHGGMVAAATVAVVPESAGRDGL